MLIKERLENTRILSVFPIRGATLADLIERDINLMISNAVRRKDGSDTK